MSTGDMLGMYGDMSDCPSGKSGCGHIAADGQRYSLQPPTCRIAPHTDSYLVMCQGWGL